MRPQISGLGIFLSLSLHSDNYGVSKAKKMPADGPKSTVILLTKRQVQDAMMTLVDGIQEAFPVIAEAERFAEDTLAGMFGRMLIKDNIIPHIRDCIDLAWLEANEATFTVRSSVDQLVD